MADAKPKPQREKKPPKDATGSQKPQVKGPAATGNQKSTTAKPPSGKGNRPPSRKGTDSTTNQKVPSNKGSKKSGSHKSGSQKGKNVTFEKKVHAEPIPQAAAAPPAHIPVAVPSNEHPLETPWTFYFDKKLPKPADYKNYEQNLQKLGKFSTLEGFWRYYAWIRKPDDIPKGHNLSMFRHNYVPAWETFPKGGTWIIKVRKKNGVISRLWEELLFACVGELFEEPDIVGVMLSIRGREDIMSIWNLDNSKPDVRFQIGEKLREILNLDESTQVEYKSFKTAMKDGSSFRNAKPYVYQPVSATAPNEPVVDDLDE